MDEKKIPWDTEWATDITSLSKVFPMPGGWTVVVRGRTHFFVDNLLCEIPPEVGEEIRIIGSYGYPMRGIEIGGRTYRYLTREEETLELAALWKRRNGVIRR